MADSEHQRIKELRDTLTGIAEVLQREQPDKSIGELWADALSIYRVQYETVVRPPPDGDATL